LQNIFIDKVDEIVFPAEWEAQSFVQLTWPHENTDWLYCLDEACACFACLAKEISKRQKLLIVCRSINEVEPFLADAKVDNISFAQLPSNDSWARDHGGVTVYKNGSPLVYDFCFNGWGLKFASNLDNLITRGLFESRIVQAERHDMSPFVLEGGSVESNGAGVLLVTSECLLSVNRNEYLSKNELELYLKNWFGVHTVLWLDYGFLAGDDTDSHIDTLARFVAQDAIMYVKCDDEDDEHYSQLKLMEQQLESFRQSNGEPYKLIALPMVPNVFDEEQQERLPATYANFLIINSAVLVPVYNLQTDSLALEVFRDAFPSREIVPIDCSVLIRQHGSLHCVTMQYPAGVDLGACEVYIA